MDLAAQLNLQNLGIAQRRRYTTFTRPFSFLPPHKRKKRVWLRKTSIRSHGVWNIYGHIKITMSMVMSRDCKQKAK